ncbi:MAG: GntR family transcriptional regulator [Clostridia bacterium]|nr:GntR family transcriptional regulator [Clostridia bacterium]
MKSLPNSSDIKSTNYFIMLEDIVRYIRKLSLQVGDKLPNENVLSEELHINRSTLREALRVLEAFGVISSRRGAGNLYVCDLEVGFMNLFMLSNLLLDDKPMELSNLRAVIEAAAIEEFIANATDYDVFMLEMVYRERMKDKRKDTPAYLEAHIMFHDQIMKYHVNSASKQIVHSAIRLVDNSRPERLKAESADEREHTHYLRRVNLASHENILEAVKSKDVAAAKGTIVNHILLPGEIAVAY